MYPCHYFTIHVSVLIIIFNFLSQVRVLRGFTVSPNGDVQMFPVMYPALVAGLSPLQNNQEQVNRGGAGIYAVSTYPLMGSMSGIPPTTLIPFTYNVPT